MPEIGRCPSCTGARDSRFYCNCFDGTQYQNGSLFQYNFSAALAKYWVIAFYFPWQNFQRNMPDGISSRIYWWSYTIEILELLGKIFNLLLLLFFTDRKFQPKKQQITCNVFIILSENCFENSSAAWPASFNNFNQGPPFESRLLVSFTIYRRK